ncbi:MAG: hypothetical protein GVY36_16810 [Verrucomicrobia bacterium]|jgi:hypothetical protein|nr:hypothetical protein [Verrucomicrobiota bacterium]
MKETKRKRELESAFHEVAKQCAKLDNGNYPASKIFMNIGFYFLLAERDIQSVKIDALTHPDWWKRNLSLRIILLTIYEWDMDKVTGRKLKDAMDQSGIPEAVQIEAIESLRDIRKAQRAAKKALGPARNHTIGHRDSNALLQYRIIRSIDQDFVMSLAGGFYDASQRFIRVLPHLISEGTNMYALVRQFLGKGSTQPPDQKSLP